MASIAIIVSASTYQNELKSLPACLHDSAAMEAIIDSEDRFTDKLVINDDKNSTAVNDKIYDFLGRYEKEDVEEVFSISPGMVKLGMMSFCTCYLIIDQLKK